MRAASCCEVNTMAKYRKIALIDAVPYKRGMEDGFEVDGRYYPSSGVIPACHSRNVPAIKTLEGYHVVSPGDWIATGSQGERWPIKPDIFAATYEPA